jgi:translocation and assembly module TamA
MVGGGLLADGTPAYDDGDIGVRADVERHFTKTSYVTVGDSFDFTLIRDKTDVNAQGLPVGVDLKLFIATLLGELTLDRSNDPLDPIRGWKMDTRVEPTFITGDRQLVYVKTQTQVSGYLPFDADGDTVLAARAKVGSILGGSIPDVPADRRFFAGGGGSVRGFGYQEVGPRLSDNETPEGGLSLVEGSLELRRKLTPQWGLVAFIDAGAVGSTPSPTVNDLGLGAGLGVRYNLGFGPLRLDIATPINPRLGDGRVQVYISIGQSF